ncbi:hypothetical protein DH2020_006747 [Rehmannia glutinosa]|uniref:4-hydroxy-3-methylbut-2-enyl diphosphate reductase n=1 Tax=Rehmannia glutinosa TaxID=99300 RepID=A0ABR0XKB9_REHGL
MDHERRKEIKWRIWRITISELETPKLFSSLTCALGYLHPPHGDLSAILSYIHHTRRAPVPETRKFRQRKPSSIRCSGGGEAASSSSATVDSSEFDAKVFRHNLTRSKNYNRKGFGHKEETLEQMSQEFTSDIIKTLKENGFEYTWGNVTVKLAESYGFCWGFIIDCNFIIDVFSSEITSVVMVDGEERILDFVRLTEMEVKDIPLDNGKKQFDVVNKGDVVVLPAFGAAVDEMLVLSEKNVQIVDTTCPWVSKATYVCDYILGGGLDGSSSTKEAFLEKFKFAMSDGFDPDQDLEKVGIANQTTMLKGETEDIGKLVEKTLMRKYGVENINNHFISFNTICDATQVKSSSPNCPAKIERQDAMYKLVEEKLDLMLVVGGWNSSNTSHLQEIAEERGIPSYWIDSEKRIGPGNKISYKLMHGELVEKENWLPEGPITIGITSGASTPTR